MLLGKLWVNFTDIRYHLATTTTVPRARLSDLQDAVRSAFKIWKDVGVGLEFTETTNLAEAELRISFEAGGSWSYVGTDSLNAGIVRFPSPTMNFGWNISTFGGSFDTALHEIGHALAMGHEHQNPRSGIVWDPEAVVAYYSRPPNSWTRETIAYNIFRQIPRDETIGTDYDKDSVMHYPLARGLVRAPADVRLNGVTRGSGLSANDKEWMSAVYPPKAGAVEPRKVLGQFLSSLLDFSTGEQRDYTLEINSTRTYRIGTFGPVDTTMALFEEDSSATPRFVAGDEDSGESRNAAIVVRLTVGRNYVLRVRMVYGTPNISSVMFY